MKQNDPTGVPTQRPKISVMVITYNHEKYIAQTLESILMQETEYSYEICVIEDCSTDRTREIVMQYVDKYPTIVKPYFNKVNLGYKVTQKNFYQGYYRLTGDYMAMLEGDDYWTSPHKLQKQVSFLEANPDYVGCSHNTIKTYEDGSKEPHRFIYYPDTVSDHTLESFILMTSYFHTTTLLFRNVFRNAPMRQFRNKWSCEIFIAIAHAQFGKVRYFNDDMAVYRAHTGGRFSNMTILKGWFFNIGGLRRYNQWLGYRYLKPFSRSIIRYCNTLLTDKGKDAELPTWYQYAKYFAIRTLYQIIYYSLSLRDVLNNIYSGLIKLKNKLSTLDTNFLYAFGLLCLKPIQIILNNIILMVYRTTNALLPERVRNVIRRFEIEHASIKLVRTTIIEKKIMTRSGLKLCMTAVRVAGHKIIRSLIPKSM